MRMGNKQCTIANVPVIYKWVSMPLPTNSDFGYIKLPSKLLIHLM